MPVWSPLVEQSPANAKTDYFPGSSLNAKWTEGDPDGTTVFAVAAAHRLRAVQTTHAGNALAWIRQAVPAAPFSLTGILSLRGIVQNVMNAGIFVAGDIAGSPTTAPFLTADLVRNSAVAGGAMLCDLLNWTDYNSLATAPKEVALGDAVRCLRLHVTATHVFLLTSPDGQSFVKLASTTFAGVALGVAPLYMGCHVNNANTGEDAVSYWSGFVVDEDADPYIPCGGFE